MTILKAPSRPISQRPTLALGSPHPLQPGYVPPGSIGKYRVTDGDNWKSVAELFKVDVQQLIYFNYAIPETVDFNSQSTKSLINYYLEKVTGCNKTSDDRNWAFSDSADPGWIYKPPVQQILTFPPYQVSATEVARPSRRDPLRDYYSKLDPSNRTQNASKIFDIAGLLSLTLDIVGVTLAGTAAGLGLAVMGPLVAWAGMWAALGAGTEAAINEIKRKLLRSGFSHGIVIGANRHPRHTGSTEFIRNHFLNYKNWNVDYVNYRTVFEHAYKAAFLLGYKAGMTWSIQERKNLFQNLHASMRPPFAERPNIGEAISKWTDRDWRDYYIEVGAVLNRLHLN